MGDDGQQTDQARAQATEWFARLRSVPVSRDTLEEFFAWRRDEQHGAAFDAVERLWSASGGVADSPGMRAVTETAFAKGQRPRWRFGIGGRLATAGAILALGAGAIALSLTARGQTYRTAVGQQSVVALDDGSKITLDTDTTITVRFLADARRVTLDHGQAYFSVAHAADRPFTVRTAEAEVLATGTRFEVSRIDHRTDVTLVEGSVRVDDKGPTPAVRLSPGQSLQLAVDKGAPIRTVDVAAVTAWTRGRIVLDGLPLAKAVAEVNRYTRHPIRFEAQRSANSRLSGSFDTGDVRSFVAAATAILPVEATTLPDGTIRLVDLDAKIRR